ncbi:MAG: hypothetical protein ABMA02_15910 [Saprospiraceae bacterium]
MIGDVIKAEKKHYETSREILSLIGSNLRQPNRAVLAVGGESGCGKSVTAVCLQELLAETGTRALILHLDDYFAYPPATNHRRRLDDIGRVGLNEVRMSLLQAHIDAFRAGASAITKPLSDYHTDQIVEETLYLSDIRVLIVEGTYSLALKSVDYRIFLTRNYLETREQRLQRGREIEDEFIERVLAIEHEIIAPFAAQADILIDKSYHVHLQNHAFQDKQP